MDRSPIPFGRFLKSVAIVDRDDKHTKQRTDSLKEEQGGLQEVVAGRLKFYTYVVQE